MNPDPAAYTFVIVGTILGFCTLAAILLVPVSRFISREIRRGERWNEELRAGGYLAPRPPDAPDAPAPAGTTATPGERGG